MNACATVAVLEAEVHAKGDRRLISRLYRVWPQAWLMYAVSRIKPEGALDAWTEYVNAAGYGRI